MACVAVLDAKDSDGTWKKVKCNKDTDPGYRYCTDHKTRKRAMDERETKGLGSVIEASEAFTPDFVGNNTPSGEIQDQQRTKSPSLQKNIYERTMDVLDRAQQWEQQTWDVLMKLTPDEMRYVDKAGAEQLRSEVSINERAQDRTIRAVTAIAKLDIDAQSVNVNKMVQEVVKSVVTKSLQRAGYDTQAIEEVRRYMAEEFERVANEAR